MTKNQTASGAEGQPHGDVDLPSAGEGPDHYSGEQPNVLYTVKVSEHRRKMSYQAMMDRGANGCILSAQDFRILQLLGEQIDLNGIKQHKVADLEGSHSVPELPWPLYRSCRLGSPDE